MKLFKKKKCETHEVVLPLRDDDTIHYSKETIELVNSVLRFVNDSPLPGDRERVLKAIIDKFTEGKCNVRIIDSSRAGRDLDTGILYRDPIRVEIIDSNTYEVFK